MGILFFGFVLCRRSNVWLAFRCEAKNCRSVIMSVNMRDHRKLLIIYRSPIVSARAIAAASAEFACEFHTTLGLRCDTLPTMGCCIKMHTHSHTSTFPPKISSPRWWWQFMWSFPSSSLLRSYRKTPTTRCSRRAWLGRRYGVGIVVVVVFASLLRGSLFFFFLWCCTHLARKHCDQRSIWRMSASYIYILIVCGVEQNMRIRWIKDVI